MDENAYTYTRDFFISIDGWIEYTYAGDFYYLFSDWMKYVYIYTSDFCCLLLGNVWMEYAYNIL